MNNEKKLKYEEPKLEIVVLETADIITTSGFAGEPEPLDNRSNQNNLILG